VIGAASRILRPNASGCKSLRRRHKVGTACLPLPSNWTKLVPGRLPECLFAQNGENMHGKQNGSAGILAATMLLVFSGSAFAQLSAEDHQATSPLSKRLQPRTQTDVQDKETREQQSSNPGDAMQHALSDLSMQIGLLTDEVRKLRKETERNSATIELVLCEERLARVEDRIWEALDQKSQWDAREQEILRRQKNIQAELVLRGGLRRDEIEAAARADLQRQLDDVHNQQTLYHQRVAELHAQADRLKQRVEVLRKKVEPEQKSGTN